MGVPRHLLSSLQINSRIKPNQDSDNCCQKRENIKTPKESVLNTLVVFYSQPILTYSRDRTSSNDLTFFNLV